MNPARFSQMMKYLTRAKKQKPDLPDVFPARKAPIPPKTQNVKEIEAVNQFMLRNPRKDMANGGSLKFYPKVSGGETTQKVAPGIDLKTRDINYGGTLGYEGDKFYGGVEYNTGKVKFDITDSDGTTLFKDTLSKDDAVNFIVGLGDRKGDKFQIRTDKDFTNMQVTFRKSFADGGRIGYRKAGDVDPPKGNELEIAEKKYSEKYNKKGIDLWKELKQSERSNIRQKQTTGGTSGVPGGKLKKNQIGKDDFIKLVKTNKDKTYNQFVEILKDYRTKDNKPFTKNIVADRLRDYGLSGSFKKEPPKGNDPTVKAAAERKRQISLKETDPTGAKGTKKFNYHHIRQIEGGVPLTTDDVMIINQKINSQLGGETNKALNRISAAIRKNNILALEAMNAKNEGAALDYMKRVDELNAQAEKIVNSAINKLPKKYKGYVGFNQFTLPRDEYGLPIGNEPMIVKKVGGVPVSQDAIDLTTLTKKGEAEFKKIVRAQAEKGEVGPIKIQANVKTGSPLYKKLMTFCPKSSGGGAGVCTIEEAMDGLVSESKQLKSGNMNEAQAKKTARKIRAVTKVGTGSTLTSLLGPYGLAGEVVIDGAFMANNMLDGGDTYKEALSKSLIKYAMPTDARKDLEKETDRDRMIIGSDTQGLAADFVSAKQKYDDLINKYENVQKIKKDETYDIDTLNPTYTFKDEQKAQKEFDKSVIRAEPTYGKNIFDILKYDSPEQQAYAAKEEVFDASKMQNKMDYDRKILGPLKDLFGTGFYSPEQLKRLQKEADRESLEIGQIPDELKTKQIADFGGVANLAGGGIAKLAGVDSGPPPASGPNPQGLQGLIKRVRNY